MTVYLVGAGPGDPALLTVRAAEVLAQADVVVYDRLSVASLLDLAPPSAERISVGKTPRGPSTPQADINALLVERGSRGETVVRLKGGDPFVFARGGEEAAALQAAGVAFEVVPGITSAVAVPAYAGIPVTHRGMATSFTVVTGHENPWAATETDWEAVARVGGTIVVLMGVATRGSIAERLIAGGLAPATPVASVQWGTRPEQRTVRTTLGQLGSADIEAPATLVIGAVAGLDLAWFEQRPLFGRRIVVTRAAHQAASLREPLRALGAEVLVVPAVAIAEPADGGAALRAAAQRVDDYDWVAFTSANAVDRFLGLLRDGRVLGQVGVAAVGASTAAALRRWFIQADLVPSEFTGEALADAFPAAPPGGGVLLPQAAGARAAVAAALTRKGWAVEAVEAYRTVPAVIPPESIAAASTAHAIAFASPSAVDAWVASGAPVPGVVACLGPVTAAAARGHGLPVAVEPVEHTAAALVEALAHELTRVGRGGTSPVG